eukprot:555773-Prorocentrum_minimum.AAC.1
MNLTIFTKDRCVACDVAKELIELHNLVVKVETRTCLYQVMKETGHLEEDLVSSFPVFYDGKDIYDTHRFFEKYGEYLLNANPDRGCRI